MNEPARSQTAHLPSEIEDESSWSDDVAVEDLPDDGAETPRRGLRPSLPFFAAMVAIGIVLALGWRFTGIADQADRLWSSLASVRSAPPAEAKVADPIAPVVAELNGLKGEIQRLSATNQQMAATIASLQAQLREVQQRVTSSSVATHLFSDPKLLRMHIVAAPPATGSTPRRTTTAANPATPATANRPAPKRDGAPVPIAPQD